MNGRTFSPNPHKWWKSHHHQRPFNIYYNPKEKNPLYVILSRIPKESAWNLEAQQKTTKKCWMEGVNQTLTSEKGQQPYEPLVIRQHVSPSGHIWPSLQVTSSVFFTPLAEASPMSVPVFGSPSRFSTQGSSPSWSSRKQRLCTKSHFVLAGQQWALSLQHTACQKVTQVQSF